MINDVLMQIAIIKKEVSDDEFDAEVALENAIESVDREVTESERDELERVVPEWAASEIEQ